VTDLVVEVEVVEVLVAAVVLAEAEILVVQVLAAEGDPMVTDLKCTKLSVVNVETHAKFHSAHLEKDQFYAEIVLVEMTAKVHQETITLLETVDLVVIEIVENHAETPLKKWQRIIPRNNWTCLMPS
jgi:hypothetical protein